MDLKAKTSPTSLYKLYDDKQNLLYIGITEKELNRFRGHRKEKSWWERVNDIQVEHFRSRTEAEIAEKKHIQKERPEYNIIFNQGDPHDRPQASAKVSTMHDWTKTEIKEQKAGRAWVIRSKRNRNRKLLADLILYPSVEGMDCLQDMIGEVDNDEIFDYFIREVKRTNQFNDRLPISWFVASVSGKLFEYAPQFLTNDKYASKHFLTYYDLPYNEYLGNIDWFRLPVEIIYSHSKRFYEALGWLPTPFQATCPIRSMATSRYANV